MVGSNIINRLICIHIKRLTFEVMFISGSELLLMFSFELIEMVILLSSHLTY